jgi:mono/diheme cytochrome c family protein
MRNASVVAVAVAVWLGALATVGTNAAPQAAPPQAPTEYQATVKQYCVTCHNERLKTGDLVLDKVNLDNVAADAQVWEKVIRKLRLGAMPPQGMPRPDEATLKAFVASLDNTLDASYRAHVNPGRSPVHRLNRAEYRNAIRELLAIDVDVDQWLPADDTSYGFDNISDILRISPLLVSRYLTAAEKISAVAAGDPDIVAETRIWKIPFDTSQDRHVPGMPLGTIGGIRFHYNFPLDAEYEFKTETWDSEFGGTRGLSGLEQPYTFEVTVDGEKVYSATVGGTEFNDLNYRSTADAMKAAEERMAGRVRVKAGPHDVTFQIVPPSSKGITQEHLQPTIRSSPDAQETLGAPRLTSVLISGPVNPTGPGDTPSRRKIFTCRPTASRDELACATTILSTIARRAYGRSITAVERDELLDFYRRARADRPFEGAIQAALPRILSGPEFLIRNHAAPARVAAGAVYQITDAELASRLALFLWSSIPDDELIDVAAQGKLKDPVVLEQQVRRMLKDPRSDALVNNFTGQWLSVRSLKTSEPVVNLFPDFDDNLRNAFQREVELFFGSVVQEDRSAIDLLTADYTFVNERLAKHYGIPNIYGPRFRRVALTPDLDMRRGLLGKGALLTVTSQAARTSPVIRGKWFLTTFLGVSPPDPPPNVPAIKEKPADSTGNLKAPTMRQTLEAHHANPTCATCHKTFEPMGFALENFDAVGGWRTLDEGQPIDATGVVPDGTKLSGVATLRDLTVRYQDQFVRVIAEKLVTYALGRGVEYQDMPLVRSIVRDSAASKYRFSSLIFGIVKSQAFQMNMKTGESSQLRAAR